ncbi:aldehyde dehydrogenase [Nocardioides sp. Root1257]|uniref:aldehyde dehydrogenase family protein n=1 Tax=unclassified Nocardioides TaxID=2615069 RepID=UPI0006F5991E|nr:MULTISPECIES: aldehyde dehydrogenase family protein [unclassified Nocardioides]KQW45013.1 aldehyde dehydrogenase [Nocardioides sp. Root1257]KRC45983.1 aldehyde dehydrogenase [Nocardioides sp. Root224]
MKYQTILELGGADVPDWPMYIGGTWVPSESGEWREAVCPSRADTVLARVPASTASDVDRAVEAARAAQPAWAALHFTARQRALNTIADALEAEAEALAVLTAQDTGNALRTQARPESTTLVALFRYFAGVAGEFKGTVLPAGDDQLQYTRIEPLGVVGAILPWNSPLMIAAMKIPAALVAGNAVVVKPAEDAPLTILRLAEIAGEHLPPGVLNVVTGTGSVVGEAIVQHRGIDKVSFTGSSSVGRHVATAAGERLAHISLELGGKSPNIVFPSAASPERIEATAAGSLLAMRFTRQGQSCTAGSRLFVHEDVYEEFLEVLVRHVRALKVGDPLDEDTDMGTIISAKQHEAVCAYVEDGKQQPGVRVALDGSKYVPEGLQGYYQGPTILAGVSNGWRVAQEEIFGPVLVVIPWRDVDEVVEMANDSHYGLAAYVWSAEIDEAVRTAHRIESGWVQVNQGGGQVVGQSYGGYKDSGIGREFSIEGAIAGFTQTKQVNVKLGV